ncbi:MAG TPA: toxin-antitoxin system HicB family antitoxin [Caulobacteraceae bacterium]|nr:toxin-antitoxin system HicB family antitoxin [Caulobacteraceae bacterium]
MDTTDLIDSLKQDLSRSAEVGGEAVQAAAERLLLALDPALRLTLMDALSQAAAEISEALPGVSIDVRVKGREPVFVVEGAPQSASASAPEPEPDDDPDDSELSARITLRLPEALKARAEALAARRGQSLNTWLVAAARAAASDPRHPSGHSRHGPGRRIQGWAR